MKYKLLELREYLIDEDDDLVKMLGEFPEYDEFGQHNEYYGKNKAQIKREVNRRMRVAYSLNLSRNVMPAENFVLYLGDKPVCIGGLRLKLNSYWMRHSGNIWYKTRINERGKGHATKFVELLLKRAEELGMKTVYAQCNTKNIGSNKVLLKNGFEKYDNPECRDWTDTNFYKKQIKSNENGAMSVIIVCGLPGTGKTTICKNISEDGREYISDWDIINSSQRKKLKEDREAISSAFSSLIVKRIRSLGESCVVDLDYSLLPKDAKALGIKESEIVYLGYDNIDFETLCAVMKKHGEHDEKLIRYYYDISAFCKRECEKYGYQFYKIDKGRDATIEKLSGLLAKR